MTSPLEDARLDRGPDRHDLVRVDALVRLLPEELLDDLLDLGHPRHPADQDHLVHVLGRDARVGQRLPAGPDRLLDQVVDELLELRPGELQRQVLGSGGVRRDERQVDVRLHHRGELDLGLLGGFLEALEGHLVVAEVDPLVLLELVGDPVDDPLVEVVAAEVRVAVGGLDLEDAVAQLQDRDVERAAAQVVHGDGLVLLLVQAVGERRGGRLVDDSQDFEARDLAPRPSSPAAGSR